jgi:hypothetical protein
MFKDSFVVFTALSDLDYIASNGTSQRMIYWKGCGKPEKTSASVSANIQT